MARSTSRAVDPRSEEGKAGLAKRLDRARRKAPTYVADRQGVVHVEESFIPSRGHRVSITSCGERLNFDKGESVARIFQLGFRSLRSTSCPNCDFSVMPIGELPKEARGV